MDFWEREREKYMESHIYSENMFNMDEEKDSRRGQNLGNHIPAHLSMPIVNDDVDFLLKYDTFYCKRHISLKKKINQLKIKSTIYNITNNDPYPVIDDFISSISYNDQDDRQKLIRYIDDACDSLYIHKYNFLENSMSEYEKDVLYNSINVKKLQLISQVDSLLDDFTLMKKVETLKDEMCYTKIAFGDMLKLDKLYIERDVFFLDIKTNNKREYVIGPTNLLLCCLDIRQSRFTKKLYWLLCDTDHKYGKSMFNLGNHLISQFEYLRSVLGKEFFKFIATWESLITGFIVNDNINDLGFSTLFDESLLAMQNLLLTAEVNYDISSLLPPDREVDTIKLYLELLGNTKHFGHPCLDITAGFDNVRKYGTEKVLVDQDTVTLSVSIFRRDFIKNFISKRKKWPQIKKDTLPKDFKNYYNKGKYPSHLETRYDLWERIRFEKIFEYDTSPDTTELMKDSSASYEFKHYHVGYDKCAYKNLYGKDKPPVEGEVSPIRVMVRYLKGFEGELMDALYWRDLGYFDPQQCIATLCRKEQELKPEGRLFVKQPYLQRLIQTSMESNIANQVMKFVPEQTMTIGEIQMMRRLAETAKSQNEKREILNLDLSKWNMRFREALSAPFGEVIDEMFGTNSLFEKNHLWFLLSHIFCNSRLAPPDYDEFFNPKPGKFYYNDHLGGMEGMRQKLWTIITICLIRAAAERVKIKIEIMCQGDNQVVIIHFTTETAEERSEIRARFLSVLESLFKSVNLILKREETWFSKNLCEFGKVKYYRGEAVSNGDKKINRCISDINDGICSFMSSLSTINTITEATAKMDHTPDRSFLINQFLVLNYLDRRNIISKLDSKNSRMCFLFHPSDFGGICLSSYFCHAIRGYDDKVTLWTSILMTIKKINLPLYLKTKNLNTFDKREGEANYAKLVENIYALNIKNLPSVEQDLKDLVLQYIQSPEVTNPEVRRIFDSKANISKEVLVNILKDMNPFMPSIAHEILRNSNAGILMHLRNQFSNISTINKIVQQDFNSETGTTTDFLILTKDNNEKVINILKMKNSLPISVVNDPISGNCPVKLIEDLRYYHWGIDMLGGTKPLPTCQFYLKPVEQCTTEEINNSILMTLSSIYSETIATEHLQDGPFISYLGSATKEKVKKPSLDIQSKSSFTKALQQLKLIESWLKRLNAVNTISLVQKLIEEKSNIISDDITALDLDVWWAINWGGNPVHRFRSIVERNSAVINFLPTAGTHIKQSTNKLSTITSGGRDYTIHFQLVLLSNIARLIALKGLGQVGYNQYCAVLTCNSCTKEITTVTFDIPKNPFPNTQPIKNKITLTDRSVLSDFVHSPDEIIILNSIYIGRKIGISADILFHTDYKSGAILNQNKSLDCLNNISINDIRYVRFDYLLIGLIQSSSYTKSMLFQFNNVEANLQKCRSFAALAMLLLDSNLLEAFVKYLQLPIKEHYQGIEPGKISEIIFCGIFNWVHSNLSFVLNSIICRYFINDEGSKIRDLMNWCNVMWVRFKMVEFSSEKMFLKYVKVTVNNLDYVKSRFSVITDNHDTIFIHPSIEEEEITTLLRLNLRLNRICKPLNNLRTLQRKSTSQILPIDWSNIKTTVYQTIIMDYYLKCSQECNISEEHRNLFDIKELHHVPRWTGSISTAICKILDILCMFNLLNIEMKNIYCLAEGSGSILEGLSNVYKDADLFYNTLLTPEIDKREGPEQNYPPSLLASKNSNLSRLNKWNRLNLGTTDITENLFMTKLESHLILFKPDLITMDAESATSENNDIILSKHIDLLLKYGVKVCLYKTFLRDGKLPYNFLKFKENSYYKVFLVKPLSSNANNNEIYLVMIGKNIIESCLTLDQLESINQIEIASIKIASEGKILTKDIIYEFIDTCVNVVRLMRNSLLDFSIPHDFLNDMCIDNETICNRQCRYLEFCLLSTIDKLQNFSKEDDLYFPIIRSIGIERMLLRLIYLEILLKSSKKCKDKKLLLIALSNTKLDINLRTNEKVEEYTIPEASMDWKSFLRFLFTDTENKRCNCSLFKNQMSFVVNFYNNRSIISQNILNIVNLLLLRNRID